MGLNYMKKILVLLLCVVSLQLSCFAGNLLQQEYETAKMQEVAQEQTLYNASKESLLKNDYQAYLNSGRSLYGMIRYIQEESPKNSLDFKYADLMLKQYDIYVKTYNQQLFKLKKIIADDTDYKLLKENTKEVIALFNLIAY